MKEQSGMASDDQMFLLYFIMGSYFGPHLKAETPPKSVLQRIAEGLPPYTFDQLAASQITTQEIQQLYYHVVRNAHHSVVAQLPLLQHFFLGNLFIEGPNNYPQFPDLFPPLLHYNSQSRTRFNFFENIVFNRNPEVSYIRPHDLERFKRLTALKGLSLDIDSEPNSNGSSIITNHVDDILECKDLLKQSSIIEYSATPVTPTGNGSDDMQQVDPAIIFLSSTPTQKEWSDIVAATKHGFALTGRAATGQIGPTIGLIDIGESEDSYLFRVSLPGVRRDEREFSCEVENEGQVLIRGVTITGEKTVYRYSQIFKMQTQNLCPTGHFSISFQLPGPVNPLQFLGNFGTDGILEGVVMKRLDD